MFKIKNIVNNECDLPILLKFENGILKPNGDHRLASKVYESNEKNEKIVAIASDQLIYSDQIREDQFYENFIVVHKKKSNKITVVKAHSATLKPLLGKRTHKTYENDNLDNKTPQRKSLSDLKKQFGTKRSRVITEQQERMKLNIENVKEQLQKTVADIEVKDEELVIDNKENFEYRPPINRGASKIENVYLLHDLISTDVLNSLNKEAEKTFYSEESEFITCPFVTQKVIELQKGNLQESLHNIKILLYVDCLLKFVKSTVKDITKKNFTVSSYSDVVNGDIISKFTSGVGNKRTRPKSMRDKSICYALILSILASDYQLDLEGFAKEIRMGIKALQDIAKFLGLTLVGKTACVLKLPIPAPVSMFKGKRNKR